MNFQDYAKQIYGIMKSREKGFPYKLEVYDKPYFFDDETYAHKFNVKLFDGYDKLVSKFKQDTFLDKDKQNLSRYIADIITDALDEILDKDTSLTGKKYEMFFDKGAYHIYVR